MGLAGRKTKQRIGHDPRNLTWANDANKFGTAYLEKFGWASGSGLGAGGEGRTKHISVYQKLDMLGIGADHKNSQDGTAWKQGKDFENLLRRLNAGGAGEEDAADVPKIDGFVKPTAEAEEEAEVAEEGQGEQESRKSKKRKRSKDDDDDGEAREEGEAERRQRKKEKKARKAKEKEEKAARKANNEKKRNRVSSDDEGAAPPTPVRAPVVAPRPMRAHRARHIAMKGLASKSATAIAEILGIPSSSSTPAQSDSHLPSASSSAVDTPALAPSAGLKIHDLTTSSKSVMDYFREKLAAKSTRSSEASTPTPAADDYDDCPRGGLGLGMSRLRVETAVEVDGYEERPRGGLGASRMAMSMGMMSFVQSTSQTTVAPGEDKEQAEDAGDADAGTKKSSKNRKQKESRKDDDAPVPDMEEDLASTVEKKTKKRKKTDAPTDVDASTENADAQSKKKHKKKSEAAHGEEPKKHKKKRGAAEAESS